MRNTDDTLSMYLPAQYAFYAMASDGLHGEPIKDASVIYLTNSDEESDEFETVIIKTSFFELIEDAVDGYYSNNKLLGKEPLLILSAIKKSLTEALELTDKLLVEAKVAADAE